MPHVIVSYDGTRNDRDALALGRLFATAGADITLAYVRHAVEGDPKREEEVMREAEHVLAVGAGQLDGAQVAQRVVVNPSTASGLAQLAAELDAGVIAFGSSYRAPAGRVQLPQTAQQLLDLGVPFSLAVAPAGLRREPVEHSIGTVRYYDEDDDQAARASAASLAHALGAVLTDEDADMLAIASRPDASPGRLLLGGIERERIDDAACSVLAFARGASLSFG